MEIGKVVSRVWRDSRRCMAVVLAALVLGAVVLPAGAWAAASSYQEHQLLPNDGVGDSPLVP